MSMFFSSVIKTPKRKEIKVVVIHSHTGGKKMWEHFGKHWSDYGNTKISVVNQRDFTLESLVKERPDIVVASDPAGAPYQYSKQEIQDLSTFFHEGVGKHLLGTYATFFHQEGTATAPHIYDNRQLAALFGFDSNQSYTTKKLNSQPRYASTEEFSNSLLWKNVGNPFLSWGYSSTQSPAIDGNAQQWVTKDQLRGGSGNLHLIAKTPDDLCIITNFISSSFTSIYISTMPEYESLKKSKNDAQFLYNCFLLLCSQGGMVSLEHRCLESLVVQIGNGNVKSDDNVTASICSLPQELRERLYLACKHSGRFGDRRLREIFGDCPIQSFTSFFSTPSTTNSSSFISGLESTSTCSIVSMEE